MVAGGDRRALVDPNGPSPRLVSFCVGFLTPAPLNSINVA